MDSTIIADNIIWAYYFVGIGALFSVFVFSVGYMLSSTMRFMQDKVKANTFKIHTKSTSRFGGTGIFISFIIVVMAALEITYQTNSKSAETTLTDIFAGIHLYNSTAIVLASGLIKDINREINTLLMIIVQIIGIMYFVVSFGFLMPDDFTINNAIIVLLYCIFIFINISAINIIDGINGNAGFISLMIFISLCFVSSKSEANFLIFASALMIGIIIIFLCFNYPYSKIFLGDSGSFLLGFVIGALLIIGIKYYKLDICYAISILIYPLCEVVASIVTRWKTNNNSSIYELLLHLCEPNNYHLHFFLYARFGNGASILIAIIYCFFIILSSMCYKDRAILIASSIAFCILYIILFLILRTKNKYLYLNT
ncbi:undecaprenyl/decaprenyl-phosphate alpha-N-acetylglucosaminyl 1-phosphate transferase [Helicobacter muridarum]|uniref:Undecaprenyl phosphate N-acetylglucosaminyltransferase n=1 Tax=Helicobacter muridarum TaxID=216 RepID=A0A099U2B6_9HELI|nr:MraY family glycosyltransferase [Helicobacter muridarum]TLE01450.1 undecaprenyl/decaprenyl-phosphate alpha-N-acetylglucosaminyl 1-phosphate transferase [Helicobacter muridarum]STQ85392.1 undecaprenyl phosphate N-acetylglucosaminyltransferase [Helicobacter muridarum]